MSGLRAAFISDMHRWVLSVGSLAIQHAAGSQNLWKSAESASPIGLSRFGTKPKSPGVSICQESQP